LLVIFAVYHNIRINHHQIFGLPFFTR
jgi:hypothetical protein